jgi:peptide subunit release factor 1 (eRF1)
VRDEGITAIIIAGDEVVVPLLREHLPKDIAERVVDVLKLDMHAPEREILETTIETMRQKDAETDRARVEAVLGAYRGDGLGVVGVEATLAALELGQVDELVITAVPETIDAKSVQPKPGAAPDSAATPGPATEPSAEERIADQLVAKARQTAAKIRFIQDPALLAAVGGVGAFLRFKL